MTWLNAWAWVGLVAIGVPVAIHFLTRAQPRPQPFPTLRFLGVSVTTAMRRRVLRDRALLAVRAAILAAVVAALAQPYLRTSARQRAGASTLSRAVVIDTSASLQRPTADGRRALDVAHERADALEPVAGTTTRIDAVRLADGIDQATNWLAARGGRGEVAVVSDFQRGALTDADVAGIPATLGVRLVKVDAVAGATATAPADEIGDIVWTPHMTLDADRTTVSWTSPGRMTSTARPPSPIRVLAGPDEMSRVAAALSAVRTIGAPAEAPAHAIAILLPGATDRAAVLSAARALDQPWMFDAVARLHADTSLAAAARVVAATDRSTATGATVLARDSSGAPLVAAAARSAGTGDELLLVAHADDGLMIGALVSAARSAGRDPAAVRELEPVSIPPAQLTAWERPTPSVGVPIPDARDQSDGRWFWLAALALIGIEGWMRRAPAAPATSEVTHARVA